MQFILPYTVTFLFGIIIGSFLNVCIYRIPEKEDIVSKRSHCPRCGNVLKWYELIPLLSFLQQRGKCRHCQTRLSYQYPLIEALNGLLWVWLIAVNGWILRSALFCLAASALIVISVIDWRTYEIPVGCNIFIGLLGLIRLFTDLAHWHNYVIGFFIVSAFFLLIHLVTKGKGMGGGDIKLMAAAGLLLGWQQILLAMVIGAVAGSVLHLTLMKIKQKERVLAFGPYLALGIFVAMLYGETLVGWYLSFYYF